MQITFSKPADKYVATGIPGNFNMGPDRSIASLMGGILTNLFGNPFEPRFESTFPERDKTFVSQLTDFYKKASDVRLEEVVCKSEGRGVEFSADYNSSLGLLTYDICLEGKEEDGNIVKVSGQYIVIFDEFTKCFVDNLAENKHNIEEAELIKAVFSDNGKHTQYRGAEREILEWVVFLYNRSRKLAIQTHHDFTF